MEGGTLTEKSEAPLFPCDLSSSLWDGGPTSCAVIVHGLAARSRTGRYTTEKNGAHARHRTALAKKKTARMSRNLPRALEINKISSPRASAHGIDHDIYPQIIQMLTH